MEIIKGYQFRMKPNRKQQNQIEQNNGCGRFVYNHFLNVRSEAWKESKTSISYNKTSEMLTELKKELPWLKDADSMALQESLRDLDKAFQNFFMANTQGFTASMTMTSLTVPGTRKTESGLLGSILCCRNWDR